MINYVRMYINVLMLDYNFRTFFAATLSTLFGIAYATYNGLIGLFFLSVWNISICIYYIFLAVVKAILIYAQRRNMYKEKDSEEQQDIYKFTHWIIFGMNVALLAPIIEMILGDRSYNFGLYMAIVMAGYTTFRICVAIYHYLRSKKGDNLFVKELRTLNLIEALVAILTLQNTLILVKYGEIDGNMKTFSIITSAVIWVAIVVISVKSFKSNSEKKELA